MKEAEDTVGSVQQVLHALKKVSFKRFHVLLARVRIYFSNEKGINASSDASFQRPRLPERVNRRENLRRYQSFLKRFEMLSYSSRSSKIAFIVFSEIKKNVE